MNSNEIIQFIKNNNWQKFLTRPYGFSFVQIHALAYHSELRHIVGQNCCTLYVAQNGLVDIYRDKKSTDEMKNNFYNLVLDKKNLIQNIKLIHCHQKMIGKMDCKNFVDIKLCAKYFAHLTALPFNLGNVITENKLDNKNIIYKKILLFLESIRCLNYFHKFGEHNQQTADNFIYLIVGNHAYFSYHKPTINIIINHLTSPQTTTDIVQGRVAYPGKVVSKVVIIKNNNDAKKFFAGNILVSHSTNPELLPIIKIAGAIITDEGGLMSHAAILAREFKIPCIIGTKHATQVFKDGDIVQINGEQGTVGQYCA